MTQKDYGVTIYVVEKNSTKEVIKTRYTYDYSRLRGRIKEKFGTQAEFSDKIGISEVSVSSKLNNIVDWRQEEIEKAIIALSIPPVDIHAYFFTHKVEKTSTDDRKKEEL